MARSADPGQPRPPDLSHPGPTLRPYRHPQGFITRAPMGKGKEVSFQSWSTEEEILEGRLGEVWNQCFGGSVLPPAGRRRYDSQDRARPPEVMEMESQRG